MKVVKVSTVVSLIALLTFGIQSSAQAARGVVKKKPSSSEYGRVTPTNPPQNILSFIEESTRFFHVTNSSSNTLHENDVVTFEPVGSSAHSITVLPFDGLLRYAIEGTPKTPTVYLDAELGVLEIKGRSIPENSIEFYKPLVENLNEYGQKPPRETVVYFRLESMNEGTRKLLPELLRKLEALHISGASYITINWYYEEDDEDMLEAGKDYQAIINVPFKMIQVSE